MALNFLSNLVASSELVFNPDHPLLLRGPDALVSYGTALCAVFEPHSLEERNPAHLASRLIASRLALPRSTRTLLVLTRSQEPRFTEVEGQFGLTTNRSDQSLRRFLRSDDFGRTLPVERDTFALVGKRFDAAMEVTRFAFFLNRRVDDESRVTRRFSEKPIRRRIAMNGLHYAPRNRALVNGVEASLIGARSKHNFVRQVNAALSGNLLDTFYLSGGVPVEKAAHNHAVVVEHGETMLSLHSKEVYASAFSGTAVVAGSSDEVLRETMEHFKERFAYYPDQVQ